MQIYVVNSGDNLYKLSKQFGISVNRIIQANGLENPGQLVIGQAIVIPTPYRRYTMQEADSLQRIAKKFGITEQAILRANHLTSPQQVYAGQKLTIPILTHTAQPGETRSSIAEQYGTDEESIGLVNQMGSSSRVYPGQTLRIPERQKPTIEVNAFITQFGQQGAQTVRSVAPYLTYVSPFAYRIQPNGGLEPVDDTAIVQAAIANRVTPMMAITNFTAQEAGTPLAHTVLSSPEIQNTLLTNVITTMRAKGYRGLNIDFENVSPEDKQAYNQFLQRVVDRLHPQGYFVSSSLAPKTSAGQKGLLYEAHDYEAHGRILDFVVLMTYEWGYRFGPPQAISPITQIKKVLDYAVTVIPRNKIMMGFQVYARDWLLPHVQGQQAETFDTQEAIRRAVQYQVAIQYDPVTQSPYFRYTDKQGRSHEVWFEDARSAQAKFDLIKTYNLRGVSYWVLEYPFPANWTVLEENFNIRKL